MVRRAKARSDIYEIYSLLFQEVPSQDLLAVFRHSDFLSIIELLLTPEILARWQKFASSKTPLDHVQHRLRLEYNSLFLLPTSQRITLRESAFFLQKGKSQAGQKRVESLLKYYRRIGLNPMAKYKDQPDHLSQVMHFMSVLCEREKDHLQKRNDAQLESICQIQELFLTRHLAEWIPLFKERMHRATRFIFYREIADTLEALLNSENAWVPGLLERYGLTRVKKAQDRPQGRKHPRKSGPSQEKPAEKKAGAPKAGEEDQRRPRRRRRRRRPRTPGEGAPQSSPAT
jgi:TorA maturation chaperone TorD